MNFNFVTIERGSRAYTALLIAGIVAAGAVTPIWIRNAQIAGAPSPYIVAIRLLLVTVILTPLVMRRYGTEAGQQLQTRTYGWLILSGVLFATNMMLLFFSLEYVSVLVNSVLRRTSPLWTLGLEVAIMGTAFNRRVGLAVLLTVGGSAMVALGASGAIEPGPRPILGASLALLNAVTYACYFLIGRKLRSDMPSLVYSWIVFGVGAVVSCIVVAVLGIPFWGYSLAAYGWIIAITILAQLIGHVGINLGLQQFSATTISLILQLAVAASAVLAFFAFGEIPSMWQIIGSIVLTGAVILGSVTNPSQQEDGANN